MGGQLTLCGDGAACDALLLEAVFTSGLEMHQGDCFCCLPA